MRNSTVFMENFIASLKEGKLVKDNMPNSGPVIDAEYVEKKVKSYSQLVKKINFDAICK